MAAMLTDDVYVPKCMRCSTTLAIKPTMKLLVSTKCGHELCDVCVDRSFVAGTVTITCPGAKCAQVLRKQDYELKKFDSGIVHKEVRVRQIDLREFTLTESDFETLQEYNNYLEMVEDFAYNLVNEIDVPETQARIKQYLEDNRARLRLASRKRQDELNELQRSLRDEEAAREERRRHAKAEQEREASEIRKQHEAELQQLTRAGTFLKPVKKEPDADKSRITFTMKRVVAEVPLYHYVPRRVMTGGPAVPPTPMLQQSFGQLPASEPDGALRGAGVDNSLFVKRALSDAFAGLLM